MQKEIIIKLKGRDAHVHVDQIKEKVRSMAIDRLGGSINIHAIVYHKTYEEFCPRTIVQEYIVKYFELIPPRKDMLKQIHAAKVKIQGLDQDQFVEIYESVGKMHPRDFNILRMVVESIQEKRMLKRGVLRPLNESKVGSSQKIHKWDDVGLKNFDNQINHIKKEGEL